MPRELPHQGDDQGLTDREAAPVQVWALLAQVADNPEAARVSGAGEITNPCVGPEPVTPG